MLIDANPDPEPPPLRSWPIALGLLIVAPTLARAGMPSPTLDDIARTLTLARLTRERLEVISFFTLAYLAATWAVQRLWNALRPEFPRLPRLGYGRALGLVALWGLLFLLILTMISGARELLTPGAWHKQGLTYRLATAEPAADPIEPERFAGLEHVRQALWAYAQRHDGRFPDDDSGIEPGLWELPNTPGLRYLYIPGGIADRDDRPVAYEPGIYGTRRLVLQADGAIRPLEIAEIRRRVGTEAAR